MNSSVTCKPWADISSIAKSFFASGGLIDGGILICGGSNNVLEIEKYVTKHKINWSGHFLDYTCFYGILETLQTFQEYT